MPHVLVTSITTPNRVCARAWTAAGRGRRHVHAKRVFARFVRVHNPHALASLDDPAPSVARLLGVPTWRSSRTLPSAIQRSSRVGVTKCSRSSARRRTHRHRLQEARNRRSPTRCRCPSAWTRSVRRVRRADVRRIGDPAQHDTVFSHGAR